MSDIEGLTLKARPARCGDEKQGLWRVRAEVKEKAGTRRVVAEFDLKKTQVRIDGGGWIAVSDAFVRDFLEFAKIQAPPEEREKICVEEAKPVAGPEKPSHFLYNATVAGTAHAVKDTTIAADSSAVRPGVGVALNGTLGGWWRVDSWGPFDYALKLRGHYAHQPSHQRGGGAIEFGHWVPHQNGADDFTTGREGIGQMPRLLLPTPSGQLKQNWYNGFLAVQRIANTLPSRAVPDQSLTMDAGLSWLAGPGFAGNIHLKLGNFGYALPGLDPADPASYVFGTWVDLATDLGFSVPLAPEFRISGGFTGGLELRGLPRFPYGPYLHLDGRIGSVAWDVSANALFMQNILRQGYEVTGGAEASVGIPAGPLTIQPKIYGRNWDPYEATPRVGASMALGGKPAGVLKLSGEAGVEYIAANESRPDNVLGLFKLTGELTNDSPVSNDPAWSYRQTPRRLLPRHLIGLGMGAQGFAWWSQSPFRIERRQAPAAVPPFLSNGEGLAGALEDSILAVDAEQGPVVYRMAAPFAAGGKIFAQGNLYTSFTTWPDDITGWQFLWTAGLSLASLSLEGSQALSVLGEPGLGFGYPIEFGNSKTWALPLRVTTSAPLGSVGGRFAGGWVVQADLLEYAGGEGTQFGVTAFVKGGQIFFPETDELPAARVGFFAPGLQFAFWSPQQLPVREEAPPPQVITRWRDREVIREKEVVKWRDRPPEPDIHVYVTVEQHEIRISEEIRFAFNEAKIEDGISFRILDEIAQVLNDHPEIELVRIEGHTDEIGSAEYNQQLSERRAQAVSNHLIRKGIAPDRLTAEGFGKESPKAPNDTETGRALNRRTEFKILKRK